jgi:hypothetical protein
LRVDGIMFALRFVGTRDRSSRTISLSAAKTTGKLE